MSAHVWVRLSNDTGGTGSNGDDAYVWRSGFVSGDELLNLTAQANTGDLQISVQLDTSPLDSDSDASDDEDSENDGTAGEIITVNTTNVLLRNVYTYPPADLVQLVHLHEPAIVQALYERYRGGSTDEQRQIYTWCGPILLAINPFERLPKLYDDNTLNDFAMAPSEEQAATAVDDGEPLAAKPHVFAVAATAFNQLTTSHIGTSSSVKSQSILVSGESGSGKTESTKFILRFLATVAQHPDPIIVPTPAARSTNASENVGETAGSSVSATTSSSAVVSVEQRVLQSNPILEAFGNARTIRNDNSSRFGKLISMRFTQQTNTTQSKSTTQSNSNDSGLSGPRNSIAGDQPKSNQPTMSTRTVMAGASIRTYLLEKVRLVQQGPGERNYHVFYQLLQGATQEEKEMCFLDDYAHPQDFRILNGESRGDGIEGCYGRTDGVDDGHEFEVMWDAMADMGFSNDERQGVLKIVAAVLHLGNVEVEEGNREGGNSGGGGDAYTDDTVAVLVASHSLDAFASLTGLSVQAIDSALCERTVLVGGGGSSRAIGSASAGGGESYTVPLNPQQAAETRDALAKSLYSRMFDWMVARINENISGNQSATSVTSSVNVEDSLSTPIKRSGGRHDRASKRNTAASTQQQQFIAVLDIFGFEVFQTNSFEQFCINYCNERLQQQFNDHIFKHEQSMYERERINWSFISYPSNTDTVMLIQGPGPGSSAYPSKTDTAKVSVSKSSSNNPKALSIIPLLDDECRLPQGDDSGFARKLYAIEDTNHMERFSASKSQRANMLFVVEHYAGAVVYDTHGFVDKNRDQLRQEATDLLYSTTSTLLTKILKATDGVGTAASSSNGSTPSRAKRSLLTSGTPSKSGNSAPASARKSALSLRSLGSEFRSQLNDLIETISATTPHYVRCIKPNDQAKAHVFDRQRVVSQLRCGGVLEAVRVARAGFPIRMTHNAFLVRYKALFTRFGFRELLGHFADSAVKARSRKHPENDDHADEENVQSVLCKNQSDLLALAAKVLKGRGASNNPGKNSRKKGGVMIEVVQVALDVLARLDQLSTNVIKNTDKPQTTTNDADKAAVAHVSQTPNSDQTNKDNEGERLKSSCQIGVSRVFLRKQAHDVLEMWLSIAIKGVTAHLNAVHRGVLSRSKYPFTLPVCRVAALKIQCFQRTVRARERTSKCRRLRASLRIQSFSRRALATRLRLRVLSAVLSLQCAFRNISARKYTLELLVRVMATRLQLWWLRAKAQRILRKAKRSAVKVQCMWRSTVSRRLLRERRGESKNLDKVKQENENLKQTIRVLRIRVSELEAEKTGFSQQQNTTSVSDLSSINGRIRDVSASDTIGDTGDAATSGNDGEINHASTSNNDGVIVDVATRKKAVEELSNHIPEARKDDEANRTLGVRKVSNISLGAAGADEGWYQQVFKDELQGLKQGDISANTSGKVTPEGSDGEEEEDEAVLFELRAKREALSAQRGELERQRSESLNNTPIKDRSLGVAITGSSNADTQDAKREINMHEMSQQLALANESKMAVEAELGAFKEQMQLVAARCQELEQEKEQCLVVENSSDENEHDKDTSAILEVDTRTQAAAVQQMSDKHAQLEIALETAQAEAHKFQQESQEIVKRLEEKLREKEEENEIMVKNKVIERSQNEAAANELSKQQAIDMAVFAANQAAEAEREKALAEAHKFHQENQEIMEEKWRSQHEEEKAQAYKFQQEKEAAVEILEEKLRIQEEEKKTIEDAFEIQQKNRAEVEEKTKIELADLAATNSQLRQQKGVHAAAFEGFKQSMQAKVAMLESQAANDEQQLTETAKKHASAHFRMAVRLLVDRRSRRVATGVLRAWQLYAKDKKRNTANVEHGRIILMRSSHRRTLVAWQQAAHELSHRRQVLARILDKQRHKKIRRSIGKWKLYNLREHRNDDMVEWYSHAKLRHGLVAQCFRRWSKHTKAQEEERRLARHAKAVFSRYKLARHMRAWREHARRERVLLHLEVFWKARKTKDSAVQCLRIWLAATRLKKRMNGVLNNTEEIPDGAAHDLANAGRGDTSQLMNKLNHPSADWTKMGILSEVVEKLEEQSTRFEELQQENRNLHQERLQWLSKTLPEQQQVQGSALLAADGKRKVVQENLTDMAEAHASGDNESIDGTPSHVSSNSSDSSQDGMSDSVDVHDGGNMQTHGGSHSRNSSRGSSVRFSSRVDEYQDTDDGYKISHRINANSDTDEGFLDTTASNGDKISTNESYNDNGSFDDDDEGQSSGFYTVQDRTADGSLEHMITPTRDDVMNDNEYDVYESNSPMARPMTPPRNDEFGSLTLSPSTPPPRSSSPRSRMRISLFQGKAITVETARQVAAAKKVPALVLAASHGMVDIVRQLLWPDYDAQHEDEYAMSMMMEPPAQQQQQQQGEEEEEEEEVEGGSSIVSESTGTGTMMTGGSSSVQVITPSEDALVNRQQQQQARRPPADVNVNTTERTRHRTALHAAVHWSRWDAESAVEIAELLLEAGADPNIKDVDGHTPLFQASKLGDDALLITQALLRHGAALHGEASCNPQGRTPLHSAVECAGVRTIHLLLVNGANFNAQDLVGWTPLHVAASKCNVAAVQQLLAHVGLRSAEVYKSSDVSGSTKEVRPMSAGSVESSRGRNIVYKLASFVRRGSGSSTTGLPIPADMHEDPMATDLRGNEGEGSGEGHNHQQQRPDVNIRDMNGNTPLHVAASSDSIDVSKAVRLMIDNGLRADLANVSGQSALHLLCQNSKATDTTVRSFARGLEKNQHMYDDAIAAWCGHAHIPEQAAVTSVGVPTIGFDSASSEAELNGGQPKDNIYDLDDVDINDSNGQQLNKKSEHQASYEVELVLLYILNLQDKAGNTPLHFACMLGQRQRHVAAALVRCGACLYVSNLQGLTALDVVESSVAVQLIRSLKWRPNTAHCRYIQENTVNAKSCMICLESFSNFFGSSAHKQHLCKHCGRSVCAQCSPVQVPLAKMGYSEAVRICKHCYGVVEGIESRGVGISRG